MCDRLQHTAIRGKQHGPVVDNAARAVLRRGVNAPTYMTIQRTLFASFGSRITPRVLDQVCLEWCLRGAPLRNSKSK
jgi:hypothetical protein